MTGEKEHQGASKRDAGQPSRAHQEILDAYYENPNAVGVARALGVNERTVRRVRDRYRNLLEERWRERDEEHERRSAQRRTVV